jgi:hypothetical protein
VAGSVRPAHGQADTTPALDRAHPAALGTHPSARQAAAAGSLALAVTGRQDVRQRAPENNNLPPRSLLLLFPRYISRLGGTNHREAPAGWPQRRVTGGASQWPSLGCLLAAFGRGQACARVLTAAPLAAALISSPPPPALRANSVRNSEGSARSPPWPRHTRSEPRPLADPGGREEARELLIGEAAGRGWSRGRSLVGGGARPAPPRRLVAVGPRFPRAGLKGWGRAARPALGPRRRARAAWVRAPRRPRGCVRRDGAVSDRPPRCAAPWFSEPPASAPRHPVPSRPARILPVRHGDVNGTHLRGNRLTE